MKRIALLVILVSLSACGKASPPLGTGPGAPPRKARVGLLTVHREKHESVIEAVGTLEASEEIHIAAGVNGLVDKVHVREGDPVTPDTVLVSIDVERHRLAEARAEADVERARAQAALSETLYENRRRLREEGEKQSRNWVTDEQMAQWEADRRKAQAELKRAEAELATARQDHRRSQVRPPASGVIHERNIAPGEYVRADTVLATILTVDPLYVRFTVPEWEASRLRDGQELSFSLRSVPGEWFPARLFYLSQKADTSSRTVVCKAVVGEAGARFRAGYFVNVRLVTSVSDVIVVPERAVLPTDQGFLVKQVIEGRVKSQIVRLGARTATGMEIAEGLSDGDQIVVDGASTVREGMEVEPLPSPESP